MAPFGPYYPFVLDTVMRHTERLHELIEARARIAKPGDPGYEWLEGRAAEVRCAAAILARDWHDGRLSAEIAAVELARYVHRTHEGLGRHLRITTPSCCWAAFPRAWRAAGPARSVR